MHFSWVAFSTAAVAADKYHTEDNSRHIRHNKKEIQEYPSSFFFLLSCYITSGLDH